MLPLLHNSSTLPLLEQVAVFGERRQDVLAGNIANIDTPNYKTRDLPVAAFQQALKAAVERRHAPFSLGNSPTPLNTGGFSEFAPELFRAVEAPPADLTFQDAGNRSIEREMTEMTKNALMQSFAVELMSAQMNLLQAVISERP